MISTAIGCAFPADWDYDSYVGRHEITEVIIPVKQSYMDSVSQAMRIHIFEHELGHGFGLAHHPNSPPSACTVMSAPPCSNWVNLVAGPVHRDADGRLIVGWRHCEERPSPQDEPSSHEHALP